MRWRPNLRRSTKRKRLKVKKTRGDRARKGLAMLPSMLTLGNLLCGFYAIVHVAAIEWKDGHPIPVDAFQTAAIAILIAMVFDMLDGRVARMTRTTSEFGGELDSLADAVTFGIAPGVMVAMLHAMGRYGFQQEFWSKLAWVFGALYACGAIVRLARFNCENDSAEESAHRYFKGLPSPAGAGVIASLVLLHSFLISPQAGAKFSWAQTDTLGMAATQLLNGLPFVALLVGYLMVSKFKYVHFANVFLKGRQPVEYLAGMLLLAAFSYLFWQIAAAILFCGFALSGPALALVEWMRGEPAPAPADEAPYELAAAPAQRVEAGAPPSADVVTPDSPASAPSADDGGAAGDPPPQPA